MEYTPNLGPGAGLLELPLGFWEEHWPGRVKGGRSDSKLGLSGLLQEDFWLLRALAYTLSPSLQNMVVVS